MKLATVLLLRLEIAGQGQETSQAHVFSDAIYITNFSLKSSLTFSQCMEDLEKTHPCLSCTGHYVTERKDVAGLSQICLAAFSSFLGDPELAN